MKSVRKVATFNNTCQYENFDEFASKSKIFTQSEIDAFKNLIKKCNRK